MEQQSLPLQISCLSCKRYFQLGEKLPLQSMTVQFKNYSFPIKESFLKENLLKTIVGFMNSKGGTIFMGVNDSSGSVCGVRLGRKQMDEFKLMIKQMLQKVQPTVDLIKLEQVSVDFVPVLEGKERSFFGKYVVKFIVLQGDPSKLYCLSEKVRVTGNKTEDVEVISAFRRHNLGGVEEVKGIKVIHEIYEKARNPHRIAKTFHDGCNPPPLCPMLAEKQKPEKPPIIFADEQGKNTSSSQACKSSSQHSEKQTFINKIKIEEEEKIPERKKFSVKSDDQICLYFINVRPDSIKSCINFFKNSTIAKSSKQICGLNDIIKIRFNSESERQSLLEQLQKTSMKNLLNGFCNKGGAKMVNSLGSVSKESLDPKKTDKSEDKVYSLVFHGYESGNEGSIQNYLQKSLTSSIERKMKKIKQGLELEFKSRKEMYLFESMCKKPPHNLQLNQFWPKGTLLMKIQVKEQAEKKPKTAATYVPKEPPVKIQKESFPTTTQLKPPPNKKGPLQLIASSLDPSEVVKLTNYMANNMFYNIQKKMRVSKEKYYMRIVFTQTQELKKFLQYCHLEQHKNLLAQFASSKTLRIGVAGDSLLICPYTDLLKQQIKKMLLKVLGSGVIKNSAVKNISAEMKVWSLTLVDNSKLLETYQKLETYLRNSPLFFNQEWTLFKVFLDYKDLKE